ncbi:hypothetical protein V2J09_006542 [Rumex salicifolius]
MEGRFNKYLNTDAASAADPFEDRENSSSENSGGCSPSTARPSSNIHSVSSSKTRRGIEKRVVKIPIKGGECSISTTPPSDSWAWRKYGQKPIKGSPYPRGYYRCSSSKGCPARKQVERSRSDPSLLLVTYSYDHNHSFPVTRNHHAAAASKQPTPAADAFVHAPSHIGFKIESEPAVHVISTNTDVNNRQLVEEKLTDLSTTGHVESLNTTAAATDDFDWTFPHMETTSSAILDHPIFSNSTSTVAADHENDDLSARYFRPPLMAAEEESLFADLGELPECSVVFGSGLAPPAPWCGSTG